MARSAPAWGGSAIRWSDLAGEEPARVFVHGLGSTSVGHFLEIATDARLAGPRTLLIDLLGFGLSDRPRDFDYSVEAHALAVAAALDHAGLSGVELIGHSLGGSVSILVAHLRADLVARLVAIEPNLVPWDGTNSVDIARQSEADFVEFGYDAFLAEAGPEWAATIRIADPVAIHRSSTRLCEGSVPIMRDALVGLRIPRTLVWGEHTPPPPALEDLRGAGVGFEVIARSGHVPMEDNPDELVEALASLASLRRPR